MLFNFPEEDFFVEIIRNDEDAIIVTNRLKYEEIDTEFEWSIPGDELAQESAYEHKDLVRGRIITSKKPLKAGLRGITLFANGRMVNAPEFFGISESSHFYSYATGWLNVDFVDDWPEDVIATNRQALDWEHSATLALREYLCDMITLIHRDWRAKRKLSRRIGVSERSNVNLTNWFDTLPADIEERVSTVVNRVVDESELSQDAQGEVIEALHYLIPEYPRYHWRHLHAEIQDAAVEDYRREDYYRAFTEAAKRYIAKTRERSGNTTPSERTLMSQVFGSGKPMSVTAGFLRPGGPIFGPETLNSIEDGQMYLSMGIIAGGRNPVSHAEIKDLRETGLFSEKDCLDGLSLLSHLMARLESVQVAPQPV
jgi:uncharacterized protein (TIGR02391 family)